MGRLLVFIAGLLVVALFTALIAPFFIDWTDYRKEFEQQASLILGKKVEVVGTVSARLLPFPSITMNDVRVGTDERGEALITVAHFAMDAELAPFLSGEAKIFDMRIDQPKAQIRLLKDGTLDWVRTGNPQIPAKSVVLEHVSITGGEVDFIDEETGKTRQVRNLTADVSAKSLAGPWRIVGNGWLDGQTGQFTLSTGAPDNESEFRLKARLEPDAQNLTVDLEGALKIVDLKPRYEGNFSVTDRLQTGDKPKPDAKTAGPRVKGKFELTNESITIPDYRLESGSLSDPYVVTGHAKLDTGKVPQFDLTAEGQQIDVSRVGNDGETGKTSREANVSARIRLQAMLAVLADIPIPQVPGQAHVTLPAIVAGDTTLRNVILNVRPNGDGWTIKQAEAELPGRTKVEAKGELKLVDAQSFTGNMLVASTQPSGLATWLSGAVDPALRNVKTTGFSADVNLSPNLQQFENLEIAVGPASLRGRLERQATDGIVPKLSVDLDGDAIDYDALRAIVSLFTGAQSEGALFEHDIAAKLSAKHFSIQDVQADDVTTLFTFSKGRLGLEKLDIGSLGGATVSVQGQLQDGDELPTGTLDSLIYAEDPTALLTILQSKLGNHPALDRLVQNARYYKGADLRLNLTTGGNNDWPVKITLQGSANGSQISSTYSAETLAFGADNEFSLDLKLENPAPSVLLGQMGLDPLPFEGDANTEASLNLAYSTGEPIAATFTFKADHTDFSAKGQIEIDAGHFMVGNYDIALKAGDLEPYLLMAGIGLPQMGTGLPVLLQSHLDISPEAITVRDLRGSLDQNELAGQLMIARNSNPIAVTGALSLSQLDLPWLGETILGPLYSMNDFGFSQEQLAVSPIAGISADLDLNAKHLWAGVFSPFDDVKGKLRYGAGTLDLTDMSGGWQGGSAKGRRSLANSGGSGLLQGRVDVSGANAAGISWVADGKPVVQGTFDLALALETSGKSVAGMWDSLSGSGSMTLHDAVVSGLNLTALDSILPPADMIKGEVTAEAVSPFVMPIIHDGTANLGTVAIPFTIANGKVLAETISAKSDKADFAADAKINLKDLTLQARMRTAYNAGEEALSGADPAITFNWTGSLRQPEEQIDISELTNYLSLRTFERERRRVEALQSNALEKQRLRREVALYKWLAQERERVDQEMLMRKIQQDKLEEAAKAEEDARLKALGIEVDPAPLADQTLVPLTPGQIQQGQDLAAPGH